MQQVMVTLVAAVAAFVFVRAARADGPATRPSPDAAIAAEVARLADADGAVRAAAVAALTKVGTPAAPALVRSLGDPANGVRAAAAEALRAVLAADPAGAPNYHDRAFWEKRIADVAVGTAIDDALR